VRCSLLPGLLPSISQLLLLSRCALMRPALMARLRLTPAAAAALGFGQGLQLPSQAAAVCRRPSKHAALQAEKGPPQLAASSGVPDSRCLNLGVCRDAPYDRCGQDEQHRIDHDPVRNHVASSFDL
jgi:hypothetical protein